jgi:spore coat protein U-like protein
MQVCTNFILPYNISKLISTLLISMMQVRTIISIFLLVSVAMATEVTYTLYSDGTCATVSKATVTQDGCHIDSKGNIAFGSFNDTSPSNSTTIFIYWYVLIQCTLSLSFFSSPSIHCSILNNVS